MIKQLFSVRLRRKMIGIGLVVTLLGLIFPFTTEASTNIEYVRDEIKEIKLDKGSSQLKDKINFKSYRKFQSAQSLSIKPFAEEDEVLYEVEPNDEPSMANILPFGMVMLGEFGYDDIDFYEVKVKEEGYLVVGGTELFGTDSEINLLFGLFDSNEEFVDPEEIGEEDGIKFQLIPVKQGTYYLGTIDEYNIGSYEPYIILADMIDITPPAAPKVNKMDDNDKKVTGTAEKGSAISVKNGSKVIGTTTTDKNGKFYVKIKPVKAGTNIKVTAEDDAGNMSESTTVTVLDKTPPSTLTTNKITSKSTYVSGKTEASAKVVVKNGSITLGSTKANSKGAYKVNIKKQKKDATLTISSTDKAKNTKTVKVKVK